MTLTEAIGYVGANVNKQLKAAMKNMFNSKGVGLGLFMGVLGASEENLFRDTLPKLMDRYRDTLEAIIQKVLNRISKEESTPKQIQRVFGLVVCIVSSVLFGLYHLSSLIVIKDKTIVYCQVVFITVMGVFLHVLKDFSSLYSAWVAHLVYNFIDVKMLVGLGHI